MERLTVRVDNGLDEIYFPVASDPGGLYTIRDIAKYNPDMLVAVADKLAAYEDIGLMPGQVQELAKRAKHSGQA